MKFPALLALILVAIPLFGADLDDNVSDQRVLTALLPKVSVALDRGFAVAETRGVPYTGDYDFDGQGHVWISVLVIADKKASDIHVDVKTGTIVSSTPVTAWRDLRDLPTQTAALAKAKVSLRRVIADAASANKGFVPVSATVALWRGSPRAELVIARGGDYRSIEVPMN